MPGRKVDIEVALCEVHHIHAAMNQGEKATSKVKNVLKAFSSSFKE